jgi:hypothetical protein
MKKNLILIYIFFAAASLKGQTASDLFVSMQEPVLLSLTETDRLDLIDLYQAGQKSEVINLLDDSCFILQLTDNYLEFQTGTSRMELVILSLINDSKIVCLIQTACAPVCDSSIEFYTTSWKKLDTGLFITPAEKTEFIKEGLNSAEQEIQNALIPFDISLMQFHFDPEKQELLQYYKTPEYVSLDDRKKAEVFLKDTPRIFKWNQIRFE